jgi:hypothetical protein
MKIGPKCRRGKKAAWQLDLYLKQQEVDMTLHCQITDNKYPHVYQGPVGLGMIICLKTILNLAITAHK